MATSTVYKGKTREDTLTLLVDEDGNVISSSNPLPTNAIVSVDNMSLTAEMKVDSGHDLYLAQNVTRFDNSKVTFDSISGLTLLDIQSVENKTKGWVYSTKGAVVTATSLEIIPANQKTGYPVIATGDIIEIAYRGTSRFDALANDSTLTDKSQFTKIHSPIKAAANLVTTENLTGAYADLGSEIDTEGYSKIGIWVKAVVNDSETVTMNVVGLHTTSGDEYELDAVSEKTLWTTGASDFNKYYEFEIGAVSLLKIQAKAGTVGSTAGTLTVDITKVN